MPTSGLANQIPETDTEPSIIRVYKGEPAQFDGALLRFNTLKRYEEMRSSYEILKLDYQNYGPITKMTGDQMSDKLAFNVMMIATGVMIGFAIDGGNNPNIRTVALIGAGIGIVGGICLLTF